MTLTCTDAAVIADHRDLEQTYEAGEFVTRCTCGHRAIGPDPDGADALHLDHVADEVATHRAKKEQSR